MIRSLFWYVIGSLFLMGCQEDYYPPGLYGTQVERLLAGTDTLKTWVITDLAINGENQSLDDCLDSVKVIFWSNPSQTVIEAYDLRYHSGCQEYDSIYYGVMTASISEDNPANDNVFTDSLLFEAGEIDYLIVNGITPEVVRWTLRDSVIANYRFVAQ